MREVLFAALVLMGLPVSAAHASAPAKLKPVQTIPLPGVEGRFDHFDADVKRQRLYLAALGNDSLEVIDLAAGKVLSSVKGPKKPCGVRVLPDTGDVVLASGEDGKVRVYSPELKLLGTIDELDDADNVRLSSDGKLAYVGYGDGAIAVIDPQQHRKLAEVKLDGHPESFQLEPNGHRMFVNVPSAKQIAVIDVEKRSVIAKWPVKEARDNFPMALDEGHGRLMVACRNPAKLLVIDTSSGKTVQSVECVGDADDLFYDADAKQIYVTGGAGRVTVVGQADADHYKVVGTVETAPGARTSFLVPQTGRLYVAVPHRGTQGAELRVFEELRAGGKS